MLNQQLFGIDILSSRVMLISTVSGIDALRHYLSSAASQTQQRQADPP